jgi:hypothetical protein
MALHPHVDGELLDVVAADPGTWFLVHLVAAVAAMTYLLGLPALAALPRSKGAVLATAGAVVAAAGSMCLGAAFTAEAHLLPIVAQAGLDREVALALVEADSASTLAGLIEIGLPLAGVGQLLLAVGLLRSRAVAWWKPALVLAGLLSSLAVPPGQVVGAWLMVMAVAGYAALAVDVVRGPRADAGTPAAPPGTATVGSEPATADGVVRVRSAV